MKLIILLAYLTATLVLSGKETDSSSSSFFDLDEITISELQEQLSRGKTTSVKLVEHYLKRIEKLDKSGPKLRSVIEVNPDALSIAQSLDDEREAGNVRGPLHGIPIIIKDNIDTGDKMSTTAGSLALDNFKAQEDAFIIKLLRRAGAVIIGKSNLSEWANFRSPMFTSGWSGRGGQVRNPYSLNRSPCGSSSGTGVAVSANLCTIGIGTETDASIVCPSSINGIVGIKPTVGLWSRSGIIPISHTQDTPGPMARTVTDAAILLGALTGIDNEDEATTENENVIDDYTPFLKSDGLKGKRLGIVRELFGTHPNVNELMEKTIQKMEQAGAVIIDNVKLEGYSDWTAKQFVVLAYEFKTDLNNYFSKHPNSPIKSLAELIDFNKNHSKKELYWFGQELLEIAQTTGPLSDPLYLESLQATHVKAREVITQVMRDNNLDALVAPTNGPASSIDLINGDNMKVNSAPAAAISGLPSITVPAGFIHKLPVGISFFGTAWSEPVLIEIAYGFEQLTKARKPPTFISLTGQ